LRLAIQEVAEPHAAMLIPPADVILQWPTPNYENPETRGSAFLIVNSLFLALSIAAVILRLYTRIFITRWFGLDDVLICVAILFAIALNSIFYAGALHYGWNRHLWDIPISSSKGRLPSIPMDCHVRYRVADRVLFAESLQLVYVYKILFMTTANAAILSLLAFYHRLTEGVQIKWFRIVLYFAMALNLLGWAVFTILAIVPC
jgi:hypothetical protein